MSEYEQTTRLEEVQAELNRVRMECQQLNGSVDALSEELTEVVTLKDAAIHRQTRIRAVIAASQHLIRDEVSRELVDGIRNILNEDGGK